MTPVPPPDGPDNVVPLSGEKTSTLAQTELEKRRSEQIALDKRVREIVIKTLDRDAANLEKTAILQELPIHRRHDLFDLARCIRRTMLWLAGTMGDNVEPTKTGVNVKNQ
jgi:hypothetical protein